MSCEVALPEGSVHPRHQSKIVAHWGKAPIEVDKSGVEEPEKNRRDCVPSVGLWSFSDHRFFWLMARRIPCTTIRHLQAQGKSSFNQRSDSVQSSATLFRKIHCVNVKDGIGNDVHLANDLSSSQAAVLVRWGCEIRFAKKH